MKLSFARVSLTGALLAVLMATAFSVVAVHAEVSSGPVYALQIDGLACPFCAYGIEKQLKKIEGVVSTLVDIKDGVVTVVMERDATLDEAAAKKAVEAAGFTLRGFERKAADE